MKQVGSAARLTALATVLVVAAIVVSGCGSKSSSSTDSNGNKQYAASQGLGTSKKTVVVSKDSFNAEQQAVIAQITAFGDATASKDYKKLCSLLSSSAQNIGGSCVSTFQKTGAAIKDFKLAITSVTVAPDGNSAKATVNVTSTSSPKPTAQNISLIKEKGQWKIQILGQ